MEKNMFKTGPAILNMTMYSLKSTAFESQIETLKTRTRSAQSGAKHPRCLLVHLHDSGEEIGIPLISQITAHFYIVAQLPNECFVVTEQDSNHIVTAEAEALMLLQARQTLILIHRAHSMLIKRTHPLSGIVDDALNLSGLLIEHGVVLPEVGSCYIPVKILGFDKEQHFIGHEGIEQFGDATSDLLLEAHIDVCNLSCHEFSFFGKQKAVLGEKD
jgi:hypothetical protein